MREDDIVTVNKSYSRAMPRIQESNQEPEKKYTCEMCARSYVQKHNLMAHQKYDCNVSPRFKCKFCKKRFKRKSHMCNHVNSVHLKTNFQASKIRHKCDKCSRSYSWHRDLRRHKRLQHASVKPQFVCDICGHTVKEKFLLSRHMNSRHLKYFNT
ncbi:zinc finger protein 235-like [Belonocnema kinseyi]|uniref:zinc finger protein 235-like n=1 Tax=Belonocnema kinseyi TaxID=2817044 RepID=UPI00143D594A|nr:zinc finger protein 235-like [Belonocnema kinseyi]